MSKIDAQKGDLLVEFFSEEIPARLQVGSIHCAGVDNAYCIDAKRRKRLFWYLFSKISWNNI